MRVDEQNRQIKMIEIVRGVLKIRRNRRERKLDTEIIQIDEVKLKSRSDEK